MSLHQQVIAHGGRREDRNACCYENMIFLLRISASFPGPEYYLQFYLRLKLLGGSV